MAITGSGFTNAIGVSFGSSPAMYTIGSDTLITAWSPAGSVGSVDVTVGTSGGSSSTSSADQFTYTVDPTTTTLTANENPSTYGDSVILTATVADAASGGIDSPTGTVKFVQGSTVLATESLSSGWASSQATFTSSTLAVGDHDITAVYQGDSNFAGSSSAALDMVVNPIMVTNVNDNGAGSLRAAITAANAAGGNPEIDFQAGLSGTINLASALPDFSANIKLVGPGAGTITVARDPNAATTFRIFTVDANTTCFIGGLGITGGVADGTGATDGGGVWNAGVLTLSADGLDNNVAKNVSYGGAIYNSRSGTLTVSSCQIHGNSADNEGGGIDNDGALSITGDSSLTNNTATVGAGIYNSGFGTAVIGGYTTIDENVAVQLGGGVANFGSFTMNGGRIDSNSVTGNANGQEGGGYYGEGTGATATLTGVDLSSNSAGKGQGGGFYLKGSTSLSLSGCTIGYNTAATGNGGYYDSVATFTPTNCTITDTIVKGP
ncbi:MAG TPA: Ig-like domain-containing protein [Gemmataceae bacterium]|nr:Ig-like domain-containing protein [Gemmataceae bacterium]